MGNPYENSDGDSEEDFPPEQPLPKVTFHQTNDESTEPIWNNSNEGDKDSLSDKGNFSSEEAIQQDLEFGMLDGIGAKISDENTVFDAKINSSNQDENVRTEDALPDENGSTPEITGERYF